MLNFKIVKKAKPSNSVSMQIRFCSLNFSGTVTDYMKFWHPANANLIIDLEIFHLFPGLKD